MDSTWMGRQFLSAEVPSFRQASSVQQRRRSWTQESEWWTQHLDVIGRLNYHNNNMHHTSLVGGFKSAERYSYYSWIIMDHLIPGQLWRKQAGATVK